jgi:Holliday junction resolvase RusA-like endonuclease
MPLTPSTNLPHRTWQKLVIPGELKSLNEFINALKHNKYIGNKMKQTETQYCALYAKRQLQPITQPVRVTFHWYSKDMRKDLDNVDSARKFILDGLQVAGILINDSRRFVADIGKSEFRIDKQNPRVEVLIEEMGEIV